MSNYTKSSVKQNAEALAQKDECDVVIYPEPSLGPFSWDYMKKKVWDREGHQDENAEVISST